MSKAGLVLKRTILSVLVLAVFAAMFLMVGGLLEDRMGLKAAVFVLAGLIFAVFGLLLLWDMFQSDGDDLMDQLYGVGGKTGGYSKMSTLRRLRLRFTHQTETDPRKRD